MRCLCGGLSANRIPDVLMPLPSRVFGSSSGLLRRLHRASLHSMFARLALTGLPAANLPKQSQQLRVAQHSRLQPSLYGEPRKSIPKA